MKHPSRLTTEESETTRQAYRWETVANLYQADGLCRGCAGQAAYGHQLGFSRIHPPCRACQPVVDGFPLPAGQASPWRKFEKGEKR